MTDRSFLVKELIKKYLKKDLWDTHRYQRLNRHLKDFSLWSVDYLLFLTDRSFLVAELVKKYSKRSL